MTGIYDFKTGKASIVGGMTPENRDQIARIVLKLAAIMAKAEAQQNGKK